MMKRKVQSIYAKGVILVGIFFLGSFDAQAQEPRDPNPKASAEAAVRQAGKAYMKALQQGDAKALAASWTSDGTYIDADGQTFRAHDLIEKHFGAGATTEADNEVTVDDYTTSVRFVTPTVAVEVGSLQRTGSAFRFEATWVKKDQKWLLDSLREWHDKADPAADASDETPLRQLSWMLGDWVGNTQGMTVRCRTEWSEGRQFIMRHFTVEHENQVVLSSTQRIGWDPAKQRLRSWVFETDGGVIEGAWRREGDAWVVKSEGALPNGKSSSAVHFWIPEGNDRCAFKSSHVTVGDQQLDDVVVEFTRQGTPPAGDASADLQQQPPTADAGIEDAGTNDKTLTEDASSTKDEPTREQLLQGPAWQQLRQSFDQWLSVQEIYTPSEVEELKRGLEERIASMSPAELQDFMHDTAERLNVLMSDKAADARTYLHHFTMKARKQKLAKLGDQSNVFAMTASQLREELQLFQNQRANSAASNAAFRKSQTEQSRRTMAQQRADEVSSVAELRRGRAPAQSMAGPYAPRQRVQRYNTPAVFPFRGRGW